MKKYAISLMLLFMIIFTAACGDEESSSSNESSTDNQDNQTEEMDDQQEETSEQEAKAEVVNSVFYKYVEEAMDEDAISVYAEIKNTGNTDIDAGYAKLTFLDSEGNVISVQGDEQVSPRFVKKGGIGYIATDVEDDISKYDDLDKVEFELSPEPFQEAEITELKEKDTNMNVDTWGETNSKISVTGFLENDSDIDYSEEDTSAIMGLYDEEDNFLAAESIYNDQQFSIDANDKTSFEIGGDPLPPEIGDKVDHEKIQAIGIENMEDYWW